MYGAPTTVPGSLHVQGFQHLWWPGKGMEPPPAEGRDSLPASPARVGEHQLLGTGLGAPQLVGVLGFPPRRMATR